MKRTTIYIPDELHHRFRVAVTKVGKSMSEVLVEYIEGYVGPHDVIVESKPKSSSDCTDAKGPIQSSEHEWRSTSCPKHGRISFNGRWVCCGE